MGAGQLRIVTPFLVILMAISFAAILFRARRQGRTMGPTGWVRSAGRRVRGLACAAAVLVSLPGAAQTGTSTAVVTLGVPPPVVGQMFTVYALVTNPALTPAPTGSITFDFGDGTPTVTVPMSYRVATMTHVYAKAGAATVTASYSGDSSFAQASATVTGQIVNSVPSVTWNVFGDSISAAGDTVSATSTNWVPMTAYVHGWTLNNRAQPSYRVADETPFAYATEITPASYTGVLLGQNDFWPTAPAPDAAVAQYQSEMLALTAWTLIPATAADGTHPKATAQDATVTAEGAWTQSSLYPAMGLSTTEAGDSLTTMVKGSTIYVGLGTAMASDSTIDVMVDGQLADEVTPLILRAGNVTSTVPWGLRIPVAGSAATAVHTVKVICKSAGTSACDVDWVGGNGFVAPNEVPLEWLGEPYQDDQTPHTYAEILQYIQSLRALGQQLQSDGLGLTLADVFDNFNGALEPQCLSDQVHPAFCGHQILTSVFLGAMNPLFEKDQRIDMTSQSSIAYSNETIPLEVSATSGLPVTLSVLSGPATASGTSLQPTGVGSVMVEADQAGDANYLPAAAATETISITPAPVGVTLAPTATTLYAPNTISASAQVTWSGTGPVAGDVTLMDRSTTLGTATLDSTGTANFAGVALAQGTHTLTAGFAQQGDFAMGVSAAANVVVYPAPGMQATAAEPSATVESGQSAAYALTVTPTTGFTPEVSFSCSGLPAQAACQFSQNPVQAGPSGANVTMTITTAGPHNSLPPVQAMRDAGMRGGWPTALAALFWLPCGLLPLAAGRRRGKGRAMRLGALLMLLAAWAVTGCGGYNGPRTPDGTYAITVTATGAQGSMTVRQTATLTLIVTK